MYMFRIYIHIYVLEYIYIHMYMYSSIACCLFHSPHCRRCGAWGASAGPGWGGAARSALSYCRRRHGAWGRAQKAPVKLWNHNGKTEMMETPTSQDLTGGLRVNLPFTKKQKKIDTYLLVIGFHPKQHETHKVRKMFKCPQNSNPKLKTEFPQK